MKHETRNTIHLTAYRNKCRRETRHRVDNGRRGPCLDDCNTRERIASINARKQRGEIPILRSKLGR